MKFRAYSSLTGLGLGLGLFLAAHSAAFAFPPGAALQIANCVVTQSFQGRDNGAAVEVFQSNDPNKSKFVAFGKEGRKLLSPVDRYEVSPDSNTLTIQFSGNLMAVIVRGVDTAGRLAVNGGPAPSVLRCITNW